MYPVSYCTVKHIEESQKKKMQPLRINFLMNQVLLQTANDVDHVTQRFRSKVQIDLLRDWSRLAASVFARKSYKITG